MGAPGRDGTGAVVKSGSRIKIRQNSAQVVSTEDGAMLGLGVRSYELYDSKLDVTCVVALADDKITRCLPSAATGYFEDAGCTRPIYVQTRTVAPVCGGPAPPDPPPAKYVRAPSTFPSCDPQSYKVFRVGAEIARPDAIYYASGSTTCSAYAASTVEEIRTKQRMWAPGAVVGPSEFAAVTVEPPKSELLP